MFAGCSAFAFATKRGVEPTLGLQMRIKCGHGTGIDPEEFVSDIETVVRMSRELEALLESRLGASGKGLHQKLNSVEDRLPNHIVKRARYVASVRNAVVHEQDATIRDRAGLERAHDEVVTFLSKFRRPGLRRSSVDEPGDESQSPSRQPRQWAASVGTGLSRGVFALGLILPIAFLIGLGRADRDEGRSGGSPELPQIR
jgi:hypothetical protein